MSEHELVSTSSRIKWDGAFNIGSVTHIVILIIAIVLGWSAFDKRLSMIEYQHDELMERLAAIDSRSARLDRYMLAHDVNYANFAINESHSMKHNGNRDDPK
jgi:hypothetical protein